MSFQTAASRILALLLSVLVFWRCEPAGNEKDIDLDSLSSEERERANRVYKDLRIHALPPFEEDPFATLSDAWAPASGEPAGTLLAFGLVEGRKIIDYSDGPGGWRADVASIECSADRLCYILLKDGQSIHLQVLAQDRIKITKSHPRLGGKAYQGLELVRNS